MRNQVLLFFYHCICLSISAFYFEQSILSFLKIFLQLKIIRKGLISPVRKLNIYHFQRVHLLVSFGVFHLIQLSKFAAYHKASEAP